MFIFHILRIGIDFIGWIISLLPQFPQMPENISTPINSVVNLISQHIQLLNIFIPLPLVLTLLPLALFISNLNKIWSLINWIWCHIPILGSSK